MMGVFNVLYILNMIMFKLVDFFLIYQLSKFKYKHNEVLLIFE